MTTGITKLEGDTPAAWIGCLACYNNGVLNGAWYDLTEAFDEDEIRESLEERGECDHEELWAFDIENLPVDSECSPVDLEDIPDLYAHAIDAFGDDCGWEIYSKYCKEVWNAEISDMEDRFVGIWDTFDDYAYDLVDQTIDLDKALGSLASYFDYDAFARDLKYDYSIIDLSDGRVAIFGC